jgi:hypothetical protein
MRPGLVKLAAVTSPYTCPSIIKAVESGKKSKSAIAEKFSVAKSTATSIVKNKQKIVDASDTASFTPEGSVTEASKCLQVLKRYFEAVLGEEAISLIARLEKYTC